MTPPESHEPERSRQLVPTSFENLDWSGLFQTVGLDSPEKIDRLNRLLVVHLLIDRLLTLVLAAKLATCSAVAEPDTERLILNNAGRAIPDRTELAVDLGLVERGAADKILRVNTARNRLVHFKPKRGFTHWNLDEAEIISQEASDGRLREGIEAMQALGRLLAE